LKEKKKAEKIFVDSQEKAFWATIRPGVSYFKIISKLNQVFA